MRKPTASLGGPDRPQPEQPLHLKAVLVGLDVVLASGTWWAVLMLARADSWHWALIKGLPFALFMGVLVAALAWMQHLYQARVCALGSVEFVRLLRVTLAGGLFAFGAGRYGRILDVDVVAVASGVTLVVLVSGRALYRGVLKLMRSHGRYGWPICIVGTDDEAEALAYLLLDHPELGYRLTGVIGDPEEWAGRIPSIPVRRFGADPVGTVRASGATGVLMAASALNAEGRDSVIDRLLKGGIHVQVSPGLSRLGHNRARMVPLAHWLVLYVEPPRFSRSQAGVKRTLDLLVASMALIATAPLMAVAALAIKLDDRGPVLYRQERVGLRGRRFQLLKLRTMVPGASAHQAELVARNERQGPLFKVSDDPRDTRVGRYLRATSVDEIPQLLNVLRGEMSLVGPRPALPSEFAQFDTELAHRVDIRPGITGLWQVEASDKPSFRVYRRLDLFYLDNWSVGFDLAIMAATLRKLLMQVVTTLSGPLRGDRGPSASEAQGGLPGKVGAAGEARSA